MSNEDNNVSNNIETENTTTFDSTNNDTSKRKNNKIIPLIIVILAVVAILAGGFYYYFSQPSRIVTNLINSVYDNYSNVFNKSSNFDYEKDTMLVSGDLVIDTNFDGLKDLNKEKFNYSFGLDYSNKKLELGAALTEDKEKIIDAILYFVDNKAYISLKDDYKKVINIDSKEFDFEDIFNIDSANITKDDIDYIVKEYKNILIKSIDMDELKKSSDTIKLDGKNQKVTKITYELDKNNLKEFVDNFVDNTLENKELLKKLSKISDTEIDDIKSNLEDAKDNDIDDYEDLGEISIYTKGFTNKFVKLELESEDSKFGVNVNKDNTELYVKDDVTNITFKVKEYSDEKVSVDYIIKENNAKISGNITATAKEVKNNSVKGAISFEINYDKYKVNVKSNYTSEIGAKIANIDTSKSVKLSKMSSSELEKIYTSIGGKIENSKLYDIIENFIPNSDDDYDYEYDYDDDYEYDYDDDYEY